MPLTIEQSEQEAALAYEVHSRAEIESVRLRKARLASRSLRESAAGPVRVRFTHKSRQIPGPEGFLRLEIEFRMRGDGGPEAPEGDLNTPSEPVVSVDCTWEVDYRLARGYEPSAEAVRAFKDGNAVLNCWPYFREFLQNTLTRMSLPPLTAPLLRLSVRSPERSQVGGAAQRNNH